MFPLGSTSPGSGTTTSEAEADDDPAAEEAKAEKEEVLRGDFFGNGGTWGAL